MRRWYWEALDWLVEEYSYPIDELLADLDADTGITTDDLAFNRALEETISIAFSAQIMARDNLANDNFLHPEWASSRRYAETARLQAQRERSRAFYCPPPLMAHVDGVCASAGFYKGDYGRFRAGGR